MPSILLRTLLLFCCLGYWSHATAEEGPDALKKWQPWVEARHPDLACPHLYRQTQEKRCAWPSRLSLKKTQRQVTFTQEWAVYGDSWLALPGDGKQWPIEVSLNKKPVAVVEKNGRPMLYVSAGQHQISGTIRWQRAPRYLTMPADIGLLSLEVDGQAVSQPNLESGRLWFAEQEQKKAASQSKESVKVDVFRKLTDSIPIQLETRLRLAVSGADRELLLGRMLPEQSQVLSLDSPLPARIEDDGRLRIQLRAGSWEVSLRSRYEAPVTQFSMQALDALWPQQEVWSFVPMRALRSVKLEGAPAVDPSQMNLPAGWSGLSSYLMTPQTQLTLSEIYRGDSAPAENELQVRRQLWLDFDGQGYTSKDLISGQMKQGWRLNMQPGYQLGRAAVDGTPRLITHLDSGPEGLEIRERQLNVEAVARFDRTAATMGAIGWQQDVAQLSAQLHLPPGWKLLHAAGADRVDRSWLAAWDLWDLFLCLIIAVATARLMGWRWGLLAALTLALTYQEQNAPLWIWLNLVAVLALLRVLPAGRLAKMLGNYHLMSLALLTLIFLVFAVEQIREAIYPQLERNMLINNQRYEYASAPVASAPMELEDEARMAIKGVRSAKPKMEAGLREEAPYRQFDEKARIQTGPGEPTWNWQRIQLTWNGPVTQQQQLDFYYLSPWATRLLKFLQVLLIAALGIQIARFSGAVLPSLRVRGAPSAAFWLPAILLLSHWPGPHQQAWAAYPPTELLNEMEQRLIQPPKCLPDCVSLSRGEIQLVENRLVVRLQLHSLAHTALPLPAQRQQWLPRLVVVNGQALPALMQDAQGQLYAALSAGLHEVVLEGPVVGDSLSLGFVLPAHNIKVTAPGWQVRGLIDGSLQGGTLHLERTQQTAPTNTSEQLLARPAPPFVRVERTLHLGADWHLNTRIIRLAPQRGAINLQVPLWPGEAVVSGGVKVQQGSVTVALAANQHQFSWTSSVPPVPEIRAQAPETTSWVEQWQVVASPIWHVATEGLVAIKPDLNAGVQTPTWQPWPGETLILRASRPQAVAGPVQTVERAQLSYQPGTRASLSSLELSVRASLGGEYGISLPADAQVQSLLVDGQEMVVTQSPDKLSIPVRPGVQTLNLKWKSNEAIGFNTRTPEVRLGTPVTNLDLSLQLPNSRWPLLIGGPNIGPAMLYWGVLIVILVVALALGTWTRRQQLDIPVSRTQWVLLGLGMSTVTAVGGLLVVLWFFAMHWRGKLQRELPPGQFDLMQMGLILLSLAALISLISTIPVSLLSLPDMQVTGNGSSNFFYQWYQDRSTEMLPQAWVISVPLWSYRLLMLAWSLWVAFAILGWLKWGWQCFSHRGLWKRQVKKLGKEITAEARTANRGEAEESD